jgi:hypothetical protein
LGDVRDRDLLCKVIPSIEMLPPVPLPTPTVTPTPLPDLSDIGVSPADEGSDLPLYLGGGLAVVIVVGVLAVWGLRRRGQ